MDYPTAEDFSTEVYDYLINNDSTDDVYWDCHVSLDEIIHFTDSRSGNNWAVAIDDEDGSTGEIMWVNLCEGGMMTPDFNAVEFDSVEAAVAGVGDWILSSF